MTNQPPIDAVQNWIELILRSDASHEIKMIRLDQLEPTICDHYTRGLTSVKPVHLMTADDLVS